MNIRQRLLVSFLVVSTLTLGVSFGISIVVQEKTLGTFQEIAGEALPGDIAISKMAADVYRTIILLADYERGRDEAVLAEIESVLASLDFQKTAHELYHPDDELNENMEAWFQGFSRATAQYLLLLRRGDSDAELAAMRADIDRLMAGFMETISPDVEYDVQVSFHAIRDARAMAQRSRRVLAAAGAGVLVACIALSIATAHRLAQPLRELRAAARRVGEGDLDLALPADRADEIGELSRAFNEMSRNLAETRAEEQRLGAVLRRTQKMEALGQLTGGIAHDFNNILSIILGNLDLMDDERGCAPAPATPLESVRRAAERASVLTRQLLGFARPSADRVAPTDINELILRMDHMIAGSLTPEVEVEYELEPGLWRARIDGGDCEDALMNLCLNAHDAMEGRGRLVITTRNLTAHTATDGQGGAARSDDFVELSVSDTGCGISPLVQERIFEPFFTTKERGRGTGLGLAMVYGFVSRSGGQIDCSSTEGEGTCFRIRLPRAAVDTEGGPATTTPEVVVEEGSETVLLVDDEAEIVAVVASSLGRLGYRVLTANDGNRAKWIMEANPGISMLISDVIMPGGVSGVELATWAQDRDPGLRVLLISGYTGRADRAALDRFRDTLLQKPFTMAELARRVRLQLDARQPASGEAGLAGFDTVS